MNFNNPYNQDEFINFLKKLFSDKFYYKVESTPLQTKSKFFEQESIKKLGDINLEDAEVSVFEVKHNSKNDPRVTITKDAFKLMEQYDANIALIIFYNDETESYRLSLLTLKVFFEQKESSNPRRYSFLLGPGEKTKTAKQYLDNGSIKTFEELHNKFDVEVVRKEFFNDYLDLYIRLYKEVIKDEKFFKNLKNQKVDIVSFTKNLLGKIVFLYFIQKKGWLGVKRDGTYGKDGDKEFMRSLWKDFTENYESLTVEKTGYFYNDYLEWLFYNGLNKDRRDDDDYFVNLKMRVPYLNGGLFKEDYTGWEIFVSKISNDIFSNKEETGILDIFDRYNFTIDEDDLYDKEVAIDPEMLGRIFEKMISISSENIENIVEEYDKNQNSKRKKITIDNILNKKLGAFYTPREIVHYMTKESLIAYLINNLSGKKEYKEKQVRRLFQLKEQFLITKQEITEEIFDELAEIIEKVDDLLKKVKILDPAIGSGAFPMGLLHEISSIRYYIYAVFYDNFDKDVSYYKDANQDISMYKIKKEVIQNNIYGVDIDPGAIDIARLRFWLSLVVDEKTPEPLPNFEFKFVCANTLLPLSDEKGIFDSIDEEKLRILMRKYYNLELRKEKEEVRKKIRKILSQGSLFGAEKERQLQSYKPFDTTNSAEFFEPSLMMGLKRGERFDIVIGNPPYVGEKGNKKIFHKIKNTKKGKKYYNTKMDIFYFFFHYGIDFLKNEGILSFITTNYFLTSDGGYKLRKDFNERTNIFNIIDFNEQKIFDTAKGQHNAITFLIKNSLKNTICISNYVTSKSDYNSIINQKILNGDKTLCKISKLNQSDLYDGNNFYIRLGGINGTNKVSSILGKIKRDNETLINYAEINSGCDITASKVTKKHINKINSSFKKNDGIFVLNQDEINTLNLNNNEKKIFKNFIKSSNIYKYGFTLSENKLIYLDWEKNINDYPNIKNHLKKFKEIMDDQITRYGEDFPWFALHRPRVKSIFENGEKVIAPYRSKNNIFGYSNNPIYSSRDVFFIKDKGILKIKYLLSILNSKLIYFWLFNRGKRKGYMLELYFTPLSEIPIKQISPEEQKPFIEKVDKILELTKQEDYDPKHPPKEQLELEKEIDIMVYKLYELTYDEVLIVDPEFDLSRDEFERF